MINNDYGELCMCCSLSRASETYLHYKTHHGVYKVKLKALRSVHQAAIGDDLLLFDEIGNVGKQHQRVAARNPRTHLG